MKHDQRSPNLVDEVTTRWRKLWGPRSDSLRGCALKARSWSEELPKVFDLDVAKVIGVASEVARDLDAVPLEQMESARPDGSRLAIKDAISAGLTWTPDRIQMHEVVNEERRELGLLEESLVPGKYRFEMLARVLESALARALYTPGKLPPSRVQKLSIKLPPPS